MSIPVITIDGPSGAGKGTMAQALATRLGFRLLDSGAVYRAAAVHALRSGADLDDEESVMQAMKNFQARFEPGPSGVQVYLADEDITAELRVETTAAAASRVAVMPRVRQSLLDEQRSFRTIEARDQRDSTRTHSPLKAADDALVIDSSKLTISDVLDKIIAALPVETSET